MRTKNKYRKNFQELKSLIHNCHNGLRGETDKVWLCEYVGKIKGVGQLTIAKMNELRIHTIADLQLHICHHSKDNI